MLTTEIHHYVIVDHDIGQIRGRRMLEKRDEDGVLCEFRVIEMESLGFDELYLPAERQHS